MQCGCVGCVIGVRVIVLFVLESDDCAQLSHLVAETFPSDDGLQFRLLVETPFEPHTALQFEHFKCRIFASADPCFYFKSN